MKSKPSLLLYIHGFNSSPQSHKAMVMADYCAKHRPDIKVVIPKLPNFPTEAAQMLQTLVEEYSDEYTIGLVGSSLGGYMSTWLNHLFGCRAVLVNPAVKPYELLVDYLGPQENIYTKEAYILRSEHIDELKALDVDVIQTPEHFWLLSQTGDEVLDYRQAVEKFQDARQTVEPQGDHSFVDFERYPEQIITFLQL